MIIQHFRGAAGDGAGGLADEGRGKLALAPKSCAASPLTRIACRDARGPHVGERELFDHLADVVGTSEYAFSRLAVANYYVSLKTNPFVILAGAEGCGKTELACLFAEALVGRGSTQFALIPSAGGPSATAGADQHYRALQEQYGSWRFLDLLQQAAEPSNAGKLYLVCFEALRPDELEYYFSKLLDVSSDGRKRLNLPGFPTDRRPVVPPNVCITATVNTTEYAEHLTYNVLRHAGVIELSLPARRGVPYSRDTARAIAPAAPPPAGYQRLWLRAPLRDSAAARARLLAVLGPDFVARLHSSHDLQRLTWRSGFALKQQNLHELTMYVANSFDEQGRGLFDPHDPQRNARIAYDAQVVQRVLWRLHGTADGELRRDLLRYLGRHAPAEIQQAVA